MGTGATSELRSRYEAAERLLPHRWEDLVSPGGVQPNWIAGGERFWYAHGGQFVWVDPEARTRGPLFDHEAVAAALGPDVDAFSLPIRGLAVREGDVVELHVGSQTLVWDPMASSVARAAEPPPERFRESVSPDGRWVVFVRDHDLIVRERATGAERALTEGGVAGRAFASPLDVATLRFVREPLGIGVPPIVAWSPDSRRLITHRIDQRALPLMHYLQSSPPAGGRPRAYAHHYATVGDEAVATAELVVIDVESGDATWLDCPPVYTAWLSPIQRRRVWWAPDGGRIYVLSSDRGERTLWLHAVDPDTGAARQLLQETSETTTRTSALDTSHDPPTVRVLRSGETIWWSDRSGWGHLYLYAADGSVRALTTGDWLVRDLVTVDEEARIAVIGASGREAGLDPYVRQLYRVGLDDGSIERISDDALDHQASGSPSGRHLVDVTSWIDVPDSSRVLDRSGEVVLELERGDADRLYAAGWTPPERFTVKAADGTTDLYGLLYRPHGFDPDVRYPVLDDIYPGPNVCAGTVRFCAHGTAEHAAAMAALGFAVVVVDGRGTPLRGKAFHEHCRGPREGENLDDHVAAIRQLASTRPWLDVDRVGIYGSSGGGRASTLGLLRRPEFFKVAVSACGDHDDRINHAIWGEKHVGLMSDPGADAAYRARVNRLLADRLQGKLLLIHGELDDNVHPAHTMQLADALMAANRDFDLLIVPNADHMLLAHQAYWLRRRWDYFVRHLLGEDPPGYRIEDIPFDVDTLAFLDGMLD